MLYHDPLLSFERHRYLHYILNRTFTATFPNTSISLLSLVSLGGNTWLRFELFRREAELFWKTVLTKVITAESKGRTCFFHEVVPILSSILWRSVDGVTERHEGTWMQDGEKCNGQLDG